MVNRSGRKLTESEKRRARVRLETSDETVLAIAKVYGCSERGLRTQLGPEWWDAMVARRVEAHAGEIAHAKAPETYRADHFWAFGVGYPGAKVTDRGPEAHKGVKS